jgi:hypothetical protein
MTTGMSAVVASSLNRRHSPTPSSCGIIQSVTTRFGLSSAAAVSAASPFSA